MKKLLDSDCIRAKRSTILLKYMQTDAVAVPSKVNMNSIIFYVHYYNNVRVKSNRDQAPPPGNLTFEKIIGQMPAQTGRNL